MVVLTRIFAIFSVMVVAVFVLSEPAFAASGDGIFKEAAFNIVCKVLPERFGAMLSAFAGIFALVSAVIGNFRGAWALVFVSVGCYIAGDMVNQLFDIGTCGG
jgi:hypothetical protein